MKGFEVIFLTEAREFLIEVDEKSRDKIIFNIDKAKVKTDKELFKKTEGRNLGIQDIIQQNSLSHFCFLGQNGKYGNFSFGNSWNYQKNRQNT